MESIKLVVIKLLENYYEASNNDLDDNTNYANDLGLDSVDVLELVLMIEEQFNVRISAFDIPKLETIGQTVTLVYELQNNSSESFVESFA